MMNTPKYIEIIGNKTLNKMKQTVDLKFLHNIRSTEYFCLKKLKSLRNALEVPSIRHRSYFRRSTVIFAFVRHPRRTSNLTAPLSAVSSHWEMVIGM